MRKFIAIGVSALALFAVWAAFAGAGEREGWLRAMPAPKGDSAGFLRWAESRYAAESKGNIAIVLLDHGHVATTYFASHGRSVDDNSLFQVASMSKWITAWGVMSLADQHRVDLDAPVSRYLTRWKLPPSEYDNTRVTVRRLLSHTAGLTDDLGFLGYHGNRKLPTIEQELTHTADAQPGSSVIRVGAQPGHTWRYSGGGYLILQLLIEEVSHQPFNDFMRSAVLRPLGMTESTFVNPDPAHLADVFDAKGAVIGSAKFTALGAASLFTSAADMTRFVQAQLNGGSLLTPEALKDMRSPHAYLYGMPVWGLGETLYVPNGAGSYIVGHDGNNYPAINTTARIDPATGNGLIVLETGNATVAREIGGEWAFWQTGKVSLDTMVLFDATRIMLQFATGAIIILIGSFFIARRRR